MAADGRRTLSDRGLFVLILILLLTHEDTPLVRTAREQESDQKGDVEQVLRDVTRLAQGCHAFADSAEPVEAYDARKCRVVQLRPPDRFSQGGAGSMSRLPASIRAVGVVRSL